MDSIKRAVRQVLVILFSDLPFSDFATPRQISSNFTILRLRKFVLKTIISFTIFSIPLFYSCSLLLSDFTRIAFR